MNIKDLIIFKEVASKENITKAADSLNYVQSNVTSRINQLEKELKVQLLHRGSRGVNLTTSGEILLSYANKIIHLQDELFNVLHDEVVPRGKVKIGSIIESASVRLPHILSLYHTEYPMVEIIPYIGSTNELLDLVLNYELDGAFVDGPISHEEIVQEFTIKEELVLISDSSIMKINNLNDLMKKQLFVVAINCIYKSRFDHWIKKENEPLPKSIVFGTWDGIFASVEAGLGFSITTRSLAEKYNKINKFNIHEIPNEYNQIPLIFIRRKDMHITLPFKKFIEISSQQVMTTIKFNNL